MATPEELIARFQQLEHDWRLEQELFRERTKYGGKTDPGETGGLAAGIVLVVVGGALIATSVTYGSAGIGAIGLLSIVMGIGVAAWGVGVSRRYQARLHAYQDRRAALVGELAAAGVTVTAWTGPS